jgi:ATP-dependent RNA helicase RhlE
MTFSSFVLDARIMRGVSDLGFTEATPIQRDAIPPGLDGKDVLACAMTGSGKTAAFVLPILQRLVVAPARGTRALIVSPTRELCVQIHESLRELGRHTGVTSAAIYGGVGMDPQIRALRGGANVIVATPGRLLDLMQQGFGRFSEIEVLVLDEADRMLDMGFLPDVRRILSRLPAKRQTLFFSATMPTEIAKLSKEMLRTPVTINVHRQAAPATGVDQTVYPVRGDLKNSLLVDMLSRRKEMQSVLVFTRTKHRTNRVHEYLTDHRIPCARIHGNRSQAQRMQALEGFKSGRFRVLVATDIAARGIDVSDLSHVINLDVPHLSDDYIHRVGRTARAGASGHAFTFVSPEEEQDLGTIERAIGKRLPRKVVDDFDYGPAPSRRPHSHAPQHGRPQHPLRGQHGRPHHNGRPSPQHGRAEQPGRGSQHAPSRGPGFAPPRRQKPGRRGRRVHNAR